MALKHLTSEAVNRIPFAKADRIYYRDTKLKGFGVRVGTDSKVYFAETKIHGRTVRTTIDHHGVLTAEEARKRAKGLLGDMSKGVNPNDEKKVQRARSTTLLEAFNEFLDARKNLKPRTIYDYKRFMGLHVEEGRRRKRDPRQAPVYFRDWHTRPIAEITKDMIEKRHAEIGEYSEAQANLAMRFLRALCNFAMAKYEDSKGMPLIVENPVKRLSQTRAWYRVERRQTVIKPHELPEWFKAVNALERDEDAETLRTDDGRFAEGTPALNSQPDVVRDYLLFLILTGLRRGEAARLKWSDVDMKGKTFTVLDTKNREPHTLPMSDFLLKLLTERKEKKENDYVFPGPGQAGYLVEPKKLKDKVIEQSGVDFTLHDLRRTFITIAESLDIPAYALKRLLNHKMTNDVTAGYIVTDVERLREPMQKITDYILKAAKSKPSAQVVSIEKKRKKK